MLFRSCAPIPASLQDRSNSSAMLVVLNVARQLNETHLPSRKNVFPLGFLLFRLPFFEDRSSRFFGIQARLYPPADLPERPHFSPGTAKRPGNVYNEKRLPGPRSTGQNAPPCRGTPGRRRPCFSDGDPGNRRGRTALSLRRYGSAPQRQKGGGFVLFLMIGIVVVVAVGALLKQQARHALPNEAPAQPSLDWKSVV